MAKMDLPNLKINTKNNWAHLTSRAQGVLIQQRYRRSCVPHRITMPTLRLLVCLTFLILLAGCSAPSTSATPTAGPEATFTRSSLPDTPAGRTGSVTALPVTPTPMHTPMTAQALFPTLPPEQKAANIFELLKTNAGCQLPCVWGIVPGQTSWQTANQFLAAQGITAHLDDVAPTPFYYDTLATRDGLSVKMVFYEQGGVVKAMHLNGEGYDASALFWERWANHAPETILSTYGLPSRVWVEAITSRTTQDGKVAYSLWLFYDAQGFLIRYTGSTSASSTLKLCPSSDDGGNLHGAIDVYVKSPQLEGPLESFTDIEYLEPASILDLETATGMPVDEFYALYLQKDNPVCFETPGDIWP